MKISKEIIDGKALKKRELIDVVPGLILRFIFDPYQ
ncbi:hypothetical protein JOD18_001742 [Gracilibacillus alcaliphilus]|nr:hypothetical protein [Gracilibacillus alcaliphilus]